MEVHDSQHPLVAIDNNDRRDLAPLEQIEHLHGQRVGRDGVLVAGVQFDLVEDRVVLTACFRHAGVNRRGRGAIDVEPHDAAADPEGLRFARVAPDRRVAVLGAGLAREQDELLGAVAVVVDVDEDLEPFLFEAAILSRIRSPVTSRSNWAKESRMFRVSRPMEVVVLNCCVTDTKDTWCLSNTSIMRAKSWRERESLSTLYTITTSIFCKAMSSINRFKAGRSMLPPE